MSVSGATITTEAGGGEPLEDWAISIGHGDVMEADTLDEDGMTAFKMELPPAVVPLLPKTFTFSVDTAQANSLDGGQMFEATPFEYMHTGLALAGTVDAALEVKYTTQALRVWVHQEVDQVPGYTKTVAGGDSRPVARVNTEAPQKGLDAVHLSGAPVHRRKRPHPAGPRLRESDTPSPDKPPTPLTSTTERPLQPGSDRSQHRREGIHRCRSQDHQQR